MSTSPEQAPHEAALFRTIREWGITRGDHGVVGGVVEGLGDRIGMARVPARIITVVGAVVLFGLVLVAYAAAWALLPDKRGNIIVQNFGRGIPNVGALVGIGILTLIGLGSLDPGSGVSLNGFPWGRSTSWGAGEIIALIFAIAVPLIIIGGIVTLVVVLVKKGGGPPSSFSPPFPAGAPGGPAFASPPAGASTPAPEAASADAGTSSPVEADAETATTAANPAASAAPRTVYAAMPPRAYAAPPARQSAPVYPAPPRPPRVPGPGRTFYLMSLALVAISVAAAVWLDRNDRLAVHPLIAAFVIFVTGLGVIAILVSLAGRKLGFLGFVAISSLLPLMIIATHAEDIRTAYAENGGITRDGTFSITIDDAATVPDSDAFDPTLAFTGLYSNLYFNGYCWTGDWEDYGATSVQRIDLSTKAAVTTGDTDVPITAEVTYLSIPRGANLTLAGEMNAQAMVVFADRGFQCDMLTDGGSYLELTNPDAPTINLTVSDDMFANTIVITEVAS